MDFSVGRAPTSLAAATLSSLWPALAVAQADGSPSFGPLLLRTLVTLGLVLLLLVAVLRFAARAGMGRGSNVTPGALEVVHRHPVGPRQALLVVRFGDRAVLVGQSAAALERLGEIPWTRFDGTTAGFGALLEPTETNARSAPEPTDPTDKHEVPGFNA